MRKRRITPSQQARLTPDEEWLDLDQMVTVEITSEDPAHPVESALHSDNGTGWRAAEPGAQTIRLIFDVPQQIRRIYLGFVEPEVERTQEFVLRCSTEDAAAVREIVRQQWTFSPRGSSSEIEDYSVDLAEVRSLELTITPDVSGGNAHASLAEWRVA